MVITGFEPVAFVIPAFPPPVAFVRLQGYLNNPDDGDTGLNRRVRERLARHGGDIYLLFPDWAAEHPDWAAREQETAVAVLSPLWPRGRLRRLPAGHSQSGGLREAVSRRAPERTRPGR